MAAVLEKETGAEVGLIEGGSGIFDVKVDGRMIYSKAQTGRFPEHDEVLEALK